MTGFVANLLSDPIIPNIASESELDSFLSASPHPCGCLKIGDINTIEWILESARQKDKHLLIHLDSMKGIAKDREGIEFLGAIGTEAIITMKSQQIRQIKEFDICAILGSFLVDTSAVNQTLRNIKTTSPDAILVMPMSVPASIYDSLAKTGLPLLAGGMGTDHEVIQNALSNGAKGCIISNRQRLLETYKY